MWLPYIKCWKFFHLVIQFFRLGIINPENVSSYDFCTVERLANRFPQLMTENLLIYWEQSLWTWSFLQQLNYLLLTLINLQQVMKSPGLGDFGMKLVKWKLWKERFDFHCWTNHCQLRTGIFYSEENSHWLTSNSQAVHTCFFNVH